MESMPEELRKPGIEISGPASIAPMLINALNPGREGIRAEGDLDDDEDAGGHRLIDTVNSALNRLEQSRGRSATRTRREEDTTLSSPATCRFSCTASAACTWTSRR